MWCKAVLESAAEHSLSKLWKNDAANGKSSSKIEAIIIFVCRRMLWQTHWAMLRSPPECAKACCGGLIEMRVLC